jgi:hypothetical protein
MPEYGSLEEHSRIAVRISARLIPLQVNFFGDASDFFAKSMLVSLLKVAEGAKPVSAKVTTTRITFAHFILILFPHVQVYIFLISKFFRSTNCLSKPSRLLQLVAGHMLVR